MKVNVSTEYTDSGFRNSEPVEILKGLPIYIPQGLRDHYLCSFQNSFKGFLVRKRKTNHYTVLHTKRL